MCTTSSWPGVASAERVRLGRRETCSIEPDELDDSLRMAGLIERAQDVKAARASRRRRGRGGCHCTSPASTAVGGVARGVSLTRRSLLAAALRCVGRVLQPLLFPAPLPEILARTTTAVLLLAWLETRISRALPPASATQKNWRVHTRLPPVTASRGSWGTRTGAYGLPFQPALGEDPQPVVAIRRGRQAQRRSRPDERGRAALQRWTESRRHYRTDPPKR